MTLDELSPQLQELAYAGRITWAECNSLIQVLTEAKNFLPAHDDDLDRIVQLVAKLLPDPPAQVFIVGPPQAIAYTLEHLDELQQRLELRGYAGPSFMVAGIKIHRGDESVDWSAFERPVYPLVGPLYIAPAA